MKNVAEFNGDIRTLERCVTRGAEFSRTLADGVREPLNWKAPPTAEIVVPPIPVATL
jgi:hypothetical protein